MAARKSPQGMNIAELEAAMTSSTYYRDQDAKRARDLEDDVIDTYYERMEQLRETAAEVLTDLLDALPWSEFDKMTQGLLDSDEYDDEDRRKMHVMVTRATAQIPEVDELVGQRPNIVESSRAAARYWDSPPAQESKATKATK